MFRGSTLLGFTAALVVALALVSLNGDGSAAVAQSPAQQQPGAAPAGTHGVPGTPPGLRTDQIEKRISQEERERLGLAPPMWVERHGKVHPDVQAVLETGQMPWLRFKGWEPIGFEGTAYVAVYLRDDEPSKRESEDRQTAIKALQSRVLSRLTAVEFVVVYSLRDTAGILGYVTTEGLAKLGKDADVVAVGLDDQPVPEPPQPITKADLPQARPGDPATQPAQGRFWGSGGKVEADVYRALALRERVYVLIALNDGRGGERPAPRGAARNRQIEHSVLAALTADEFWLHSKTSAFPSMDGIVTRAGLNKLESHAYVVAVGLTNPPISSERD